MSVSKRDIKLDNLQSEILLTCLNNVNDYEVDGTA